MSDSLTLLALAAFAAAAAGLGAGAALKGWQDWLDLKRQELANGGGARRAPTLADLRDRVRRLEAIADGGEA
jgi:hypothetical protein